jgi:DNA modification methylase
MKIRASDVALHNADCFDILKSIPDDSIDACITDPPYGIRMKNAHVTDDEEWDTFESDAEFAAFTTRWLAEVYRVLKPEGTCWVFTGPTQIPSMFDSIERTGFINHLDNWVVMARNKGRGSKKKLKSLREDILHLTKSPTYTWNAVEYVRRVIVPYMVEGQKRGWDYRDGVPMRFTSAGNIMAFSDYEMIPGKKIRGRIPDISSGESLLFDGSPSDVVFFTPPFYLSKFEKQIHSCQKSVMCLTLLTMLCTEAGNTIIDPFMGSGASGVASIICDRNYIGVEKNLECFNKANSWLNDIDWDASEEYVKSHLSSSEKKFKFGFSSRDILKK